MAKCILAKYGGSSYNGAKVLEGEYRSSTLYVDDYKDGDIITFTASSDIDTTPDPAQGIMGGLNVCNNKTHTTLNMTVSPYVIKAGVVYLKVTNVSGSVWHLSNLDKADDAIAIRRVMPSSVNIGANPSDSTMYDTTGWVSVKTSYSANTYYDFTITDNNVDFTKANTLIRIYVEQVTKSVGQESEVNFRNYGGILYILNGSVLYRKAGGDYLTLDTSSVTITAHTITVRLKSPNASSYSSSYWSTYTKMGIVGYEVDSFSNVKSSQLVSNTYNVNYLPSNVTISSVNVNKTMLISDVVGHGYNSASSMSNTLPTLLRSSTSIALGAGTICAIIEFN